MLIDIIKKDIDDNKDVLIYFFPSKHYIKTNYLIKNVIAGKGIKYSKDKIWYPKEIWFYNPIQAVKS